MVWESLEMGTSRRVVNETTEEVEVEGSGTAVGT